MDTQVLISHLAGLLQQYSSALIVMVGAISALGLFHRKVVRPALVSVVNMGEEVHALRELAQAQLTSDSGLSLLDMVRHAAVVAETVKVALDEEKGHNDERWTSLDGRLQVIERKAPANIVVNQAPQAGVKPP